LQEWAKEYRAEIERCKMFIENAGEANGKWRTMESSCC
jgi:hypothetical protein